MGVVGSSVTKIFVLLLRSAKYALQHLCTQGRIHKQNCETFVVQVKIVAFGDIYIYICVCIYICMHIYYTYNAQNKIVLFFVEKCYVWVYVTLAFLSVKTAN